MDGLLRTHFAASDFDGAVRDNLIYVHVGLRTAAGLPDAQRELIVTLARDDFVGRFDDEPGFVRGELAQVLVDERRSFFQDAESADQFGWHSVAANVEVL